MSLPISKPMESDYGVNSFGSVAASLTTMDAECRSINSEIRRDLVKLQETGINLGLKATQDAQSDTEAKYNAQAEGLYMQAAQSGAQALVSGLQMCANARNSPEKEARDEVSQRLQQREDVLALANNSTKPVSSAAVSGGEPAPGTTPHEDPQVTAAREDLEQNLGEGAGRSTKFDERAIASMRTRDEQGFQNFKARLQEEIRADRANLAAKEQMISSNVTRNQEVGNMANSLVGAASNGFQGATTAKSGEFEAQVQIDNYLAELERRLVDGYNQISDGLTHLIDQRGEQACATIQALARG